MSGELVVALLLCVLELVGVIITVIIGNSKTQYRIEELEKKQDAHNSLIVRMFNVEKRLDVDEEKIRVANHRIKDLEGKK
jgi:hypothetical protein